jgi:hypothetical protein
MCLSLAIRRPGDVLNRGVHCGLEWVVIHNTHGYRCGYVRVPRDHPWYGDPEPPVKVHGDVTFAEHDVPCDKGGADDGWWIGFACDTYEDAPDPNLPSNWPYDHVAYDGMGVVRTQEYVERQCASLCEQVAARSGVSLDGGAQ